MTRALQFTNGQFLNFHYSGRYSFGQFARWKGLWCCCGRRETVGMIYTLLLIPFGRLSRSNLKVLTSNVLAIGIFHRMDTSHNFCIKIQAGGVVNKVPSLFTTTRQKDTKIRQVRFEYLFQNIYYLTTRVERVWETTWRKYAGKQRANFLANNTHQEVCIWVKQLSAYIIIIFSICLLLVLHSTTSSTRAKTQRSLPESFWIQSLPNASK